MLHVTATIYYSIWSTFLLNIYVYNQTAHLRIPTQYLCADQEGRTLTVNSVSSKPLTSTTPQSYYMLWSHRNIILKTQCSLIFPQTLENLCQTRRLHTSKALCSTNFKDSLNIIRLEELWYKKLSTYFHNKQIHIFIHSFHNLSYDRSIASSKVSSPEWDLLLPLSVSNILSFP